MLRFADSVANHSNHRRNGWQVIEYRKPLTFLSELRGRLELLREDNTGKVYILANLTARPPLLMAELWKMWFILDTNDISIQLSLPAFNVVIGREGKLGFRAMDELKDLVPDAEFSLPAFNVVTGSYYSRSLTPTLLEFKNAFRTVSRVLVIAADNSYPPPPPPPPVALCRRGPNDVSVLAAILLT
eukprot:jgi/Tetstr1/440409/TSEL_028743.t1